MKSLNITLSELILSAVYFLQKKNGVSAKDITKFICEKRGLKQAQMKNKIKQALQRGTQNGIFNLKRGLYKVQADYRNKLRSLKKSLKKKSHTKKGQKKMEMMKTSKKIHVDDEEKPIDNEPMPLTSVEEETNKSTMFKNQNGSRSMSEDIFDRSRREHSYFEPSSLARASDEEYLSEDDEEDDDDDDYSDVNDPENLDIYTITNANDASNPHFPALKIFSAIREAKQRKVSAKRKQTNKTRTKNKGRKRKMSRPCNKSTRQSRDRKKRQKQLETDDDDFFDEDDSESPSESDTEKRNKKPKTTLKSQWKSEQENKTKPEESKNIENKENKMSKTNKGSQSNKANKSEKGSKGTKFHKITKDNKVSAGNEGKHGPEVNKKRKQMHKSRQRSRKEEYALGENRDSILSKNDMSSIKSECIVTSSTKLLPSDIKLSISSNLIVSDVKFSPTNVKFETRETADRVFSRKLEQQHQYRQQPQQSPQQRPQQPQKQKQQERSPEEQRQKELEDDQQDSLDGFVKAENMNDVEYYCECKTYKKKNPSSFSYSANPSPMRDV